VICLPIRQGASFALHHTARKQGESDSLEAIVTTLRKTPKKGLPF